MDSHQNKWQVTLCYHSTHNHRGGITHTTRTSQWWNRLHVTAVVELLTTIIMETLINYVNNREIIVSINQSYYKSMLTMVKNISNMNLTDNINQC